MSRIELLRGKIIDNEEKIIQYNTLIEKLGSAGQYLDNCATNLLSAGDYLADGLIVENLPADNGKINDLALRVSKNVTRLSDIGSIASNKIELLKDEIDNYNKEISRIEELERLQREKLQQEVEKELL